MLQFLLKRAISLVFILFSLTFITFIMGYLAPGDPIAVRMGNHYNPALHAQLLHLYGLDRPWWQQYISYITGVLHGDFGTSFTYRDYSVWEIINRGLPVSIELGLEVLAVTILIGIPIGILTALYPNTALDTSLNTLMLLFYAIPDFVLIVWFQVAMVWLFLHGLPILPIAGWQHWQDRIAPVLITATTGAGYLVRFTRTAVLETISQDFIRTARSKGLKEYAVLYIHTFRYACIPLLNYIGSTLGFIVTGLFITETLFNIHGVSSVALDAIGTRDYPILQATTILIGTSVVVFNALTDICIALVDPRIRLS